MWKAGLTAVLVLLTATIGWAAPEGPTEKIGQGRAAEVAPKVMPRLSKLMEKAGVSVGAPVYIRIFKQTREMEIWAEGNDGKYRQLKTYPVCYVSGTLGPKAKAGDQQAPEGFYTVTADRLNPWSEFHLSMDVGYPNRYDRAHGRSGSYIMVHGDCVSRGCFAMTDEGIEDIYTLVELALRNGQTVVPVHIFPFRMTEKNMGQQTKSPWLRFWQNLKIGYDLFEKRRRPPSVLINADTREYVFLRI